MYLYMYSPSYESCLTMNLSRGNGNLDLWLSFTATRSLECLRFHQIFILIIEGVAEVLEWNVGLKATYFLRSSGLSCNGDIQSDWKLTALLRHPT